MTEVGAYANAVSTFAAFASVGALWLHWLRWKHDQRTKSLIVKLNRYGKDNDAGDWSLSKLTLRSRSNTGYTAECIRILWPPSGRIAWRGDLFSVPGENEWDPKGFKEPPQTKRKLSINLVVSHVGQQSKFHSQGHFRIAYGDEESVDFYLRRRGTGRLLIAVDITPEDDSERSFTRRKVVRV